MPQKTRNIKLNKKLHVAGSIFHKLTHFLAVLFFVIWIVIGLFFLLFIYGNFKQGAFRGLLSQAPQQQTPSQQAPTETDLPGVGKVNIGCIQNSLTPEVIQKLVKDGNTDNLTDEEKASLNPCIVAPEETTSKTIPEASPNQ